MTKRYVAQFRQPDVTEWVNDNWWDDYDSAEAHIILMLTTDTHFTHGRVFDSVKRLSGDILNRAEAQNLRRLLGE